MAKTKEDRLEIRLTAEMKRDIERVARTYGTTPSGLLRGLFARHWHGEWLQRTKR